MNIGEIVSLTGNIALALRGIEDHVIELGREIYLGHVEGGDEHHALDLALEEWRLLAHGLGRFAPVLAAVDAVRSKLDAVPPAARSRIELRLLMRLGVVTRAVADLLEELQADAVEAASERAAAAEFA